MAKPSGTNRPRLARLLGGIPRRGAPRRHDRPCRLAFFLTFVNPIRRRSPAERDCGGNSVWAHLFPFRTEKLKQTAPMVLPEEGGRVGRRPIPQRPSARGAFFLSPPHAAARAGHGPCCVHFGNIPKSVYFRFPFCVASSFRAMETLSAKSFPCKLAEDNRFLSSH